MIIDLPKCDASKPYIINENMEIEDGILKLKFPYSLRNAMHFLTYEIKGKHECFYCGKEIINNKATLDHLFPQDLGGPTITNNLVPSCSTCNSQKSNMTEEQYRKFLSLPITQRKQYLRDLQKVVEFIHKWYGFYLPKDWVEEKEISNIIVNISLTENYKGPKYNKTEEFYKKYSQFRRPLIIDRKNFLLDGFTILMYAKNENIQKVPVIVLENVEVIF